MPPSADAGGPYDVASGGAVQLAGSGADPSPGDVLTFAWDLDGDGVFGETGTDATRGDEDLMYPSTSVRLRIV